MIDDNGWKEWSKYVLNELERLHDTSNIGTENYREVSVCLAKIKVSIDNLAAVTSKLVDSVDVINTEMAGLKIKSGIWGAIGAAIPVIGLLLWQLLT